MAAHTPEAEKEKQFLETVFQGKDVGFSRQRPENSFLRICKELKETLLEELEENTTVLQEQRLSGHGTSQNKQKKHGVEECNNCNKKLTKGFYLNK